MNKKIVIGDGQKKAALLAAAAILIYAVTSQVKKDIPLQTIKKKYEDEASKYMEIDGMQVHYRDEGHGMPVLLLHGSGESLHAFEVWTALLKEQFRVIRLDMPGAGLTGPHPEKKYAVTEYTEFIHKFLEKLQIQQVSIAGHSSGGFIAWRYTLQFPEQIHKLILISSAGYALKEKLPPPFFYTKNILARKTGPFFTPKAAIILLARSAFGNKKRLTQKTIDRYYDLLLREGNREAFLDIANTPVDFQSDLPKQIKKPTLVLWGSHDKWIPLEFGERLHKDIESSEFIVYAGVGHALPEEFPDQSAEDVKTFLLTSKE